MRSGAVVRCTACENKYRIKSAYVLREVHTGPRTLDETDSVLRSDSVDIDPDEMSPVSIDDEGNVVGLSGLSELMRWSDAEATNRSTDVSTAVHDRIASEQNAPLPTATPASAKKQQSTVGTGRARAQALKRKKQKKTYITFAGTFIVLVALVLIAVQLLGGKSPDTTADSDKPADQNEETPVATTSAGPALLDKTPDPSPPRDETVGLFDKHQPEPNPDQRFVAPWLEQNQANPPTDIPTVLTPATPLTHEGWYIMNPPRGAADASGTSNVELSQIRASPLNDKQTLLATSITNSSAQAVIRGELHMMLLDSTGNVFAETYAPLAMVGPSDKQPYALTIPTRYWKRSRGVRAAVTVQEWADQPTALKDVRLHPVDLGESSALRISVKHTGDKVLRSATILINATDNDGNALASFLFKEENLYIRKDHWLDLLIATPLPPGKQSANWSATVVPQ